MLPNQLELKSSKQKQNYAHYYLRKHLSSLTYHTQRKVSMWLSVLLLWSRTVEPVGPGGMQHPVGALSGCTCRLYEATSWARDLRPAWPQPRPGPHQHQANVQDCRLSQSSLCRGRPVWRVQQQWRRGGGLVGNTLHPVLSRSCDGQTSECATWQKKSKLNKNIFTDVLINIITLIYLCHSWCTFLYYTLYVTQSSPINMKICCLWKQMP